jgi:hypothetical protein
MKKSNPGFRLQIAVSVVAMLALLAQAQAEPVVPPAKSIKAEETAILLVDFQANFVSPDGAWYQKFAQHYAKTRMLERTVELVSKARAKGVLIVHITEGYVGLSRARSCRSRRLSPRADRPRCLEDRPKEPRIMSR